MLKSKRKNNYGNISSRPVPEHFDEFVKWLKEESGLSESTYKGVRKRVRLAHSICKIEDTDGYIEKLKMRARYKKLKPMVQSNVKYAVKVYFKFLDKFVF